MKSTALSDINLTLYLNIGSNIGDRRSNILRAVALIKRQEWILPDTMRLSDFIQSEPWGYESINTYTNLGVAADIYPEKHPLEILHSIHLIQSQIDPAPHRDSYGNYIDRIIDIDIIAIDNMVFNHPELIIPHPRMHIRPFVLRPVQAIAPDWVHPILGKLW